MRTYRWGQAPRAPPFTESAVIVSNLCGLLGTQAFECQDSVSCDAPPASPALPYKSSEAVFAFTGLNPEFFIESANESLSQLILVGSQLNILSTNYFQAVFNLTFTGSVPPESINTVFTGRAVGTDAGQILLSAEDCSSDGNEINTCAIFLGSSNGCQQSIDVTQIDTMLGLNHTVIILPQWCNSEGSIQYICNTTGCPAPVNKTSQGGVQAGNCLVFNGNTLNVQGGPGCELSNTTVTNQYVTNQTVNNQYVTNQTVQDQTVQNLAVQQQLDLCFDDDSTLNTQKMRACDANGIGFYEAGPTVTRFTKTFHGKVIIAPDMDSEQYGFYDSNWLPSFRIISELFSFDVTLGFRNFVVSGQGYSFTSCAGTTASAPVHYQGQRIGNTATLWLSDYGDPADTMPSTTVGCTALIWASTNLPSALIPSAIAISTPILNFWYSEGENDPTPLNFVAQPSVTTQNPFYFINSCSLGGAMCAAPLGTTTTTAEEWRSFKVLSGHAGAVIPRLSIQHTFTYFANSWDSY